MYEKLISRIQKFVNIWVVFLYVVNGWLFWYANILNEKIFGVPQIPKSNMELWISIWIFGKMKNNCEQKAG